MDWSGAAVLASGTIGFVGDGTVSTGPVAVAGVGCYAWSDPVTGTAFLGDAVLPAGTPGEIVQVDPFDPSLMTTADMSTTASGATASDAVTVSGSGLGPSPNVASTSLAWALYGPASPPAGSCSNVQWSTVPILVGGTIMITGDGTIHTPARAIDAIGCYSSGEQLSATVDARSATADPGPAGETVHIQTVSTNSSTGGSVAVTDSGTPSRLAFTGLAGLGAAVGAGIPACLAGSALVFLVVVVVVE